jgi:hypothetical protein
MSFDPNAALSDYPNVTRVLGKTWLLSEFAKPPSQRHIAAFYFQRAFEDKETISKAFQKLSSGNEVELRDAFLRLGLLREPTHSMELLEKCLPILESQMLFNELVAEMKKSDSEFESSLSVIFYACYFMERGKTILFPKLKVSEMVTKTPDLEVILDRRSVYIEVTTPRMAQILQENLGKIVPLKQRAPGQIIEEYEGNFRKVVDAGLLNNAPIIIALDCSHSEIRDDDVEAAIFGTPFLRFTVNTQTHELVSQEWLRNKNSGISNVPGTDMISAVLWNKDVLVQKNGRTTILGKLFENPKAKSPLTKEELAKIDLVPFQKLL